ncbi:MAG: hypothetical protein NBKEAIPA_01666 [Nitrospirae bacterium]|nr:hypothetical protein [Nitrospirota bacterium]
MPGHTGNGRGVEQIGVVLKGPFQPRLRLGHVQREIELRCRRIDFGDVDLQPGQPDGLGQRRLQRKQHLKQR